MQLPLEPNDAGVPLHRLSHKFGLIKVKSAKFSLQQAMKAPVVGQ